MPSVTFGLARILMGPYNPATAQVAPSPSVGMPPAAQLIERFNYTVPESAELVTEEGTTTDINIEESDTAIISQTSAGAKRFSFSTYNTENAAMIWAFGGTVAGGIWSAPANIQALMAGVRVETNSNVYYEFPKVSFQPRLNVSYAKTAAGQIDLVGTILVPDTAGIPDIRKGALA